MNNKNKIILIVCIVGLGMNFYVSIFFRLFALFLIAWYSTHILIFCYKILNNSYEVINYNNISDDEINKLMNKLTHILESKL